MTATPELRVILEQVEAALSAMITAGETGTVTVHCGNDQVVVKANPERKYDPIRLDRPRMNVIRRSR